MAVGVAGVMGAGLAILPDIGTPLVAWRLFFTPNFAAPMVLDVWFVNLNVVLGALLLFALHKQNEGLAKALTTKLGVTVKKLPQDPQIAGAIGAALIAEENFLRGYKLGLDDATTLETETETVAGNEE